MSKLMRQWVAGQLKYASDITYSFVQSPRIGEASNPVGLQTAWAAYTRDRGLWNKHARTCT